MAPFPRQGITGCRNNAVQMRMQRKVLPPSVQHRNGSGFTTVMCITEAVQRTAGSTEQDVAIKPSVPQINLVELMRYRENDVVVDFISFSTQRACLVPWHLGQWRCSALRNKLRN